MHHGVEHVQIMRRKGQKLTDEKRDNDRGDDMREGIEHVADFMDVGKH